MLRGGDERLVKWNRQDLMHTVVANVAYAQQPVIGRRVLNVEGPVLRVGQLVVDVVAAEKERSEQIAAWIVA